MSDFDRITWDSFRNSSGETVPPYGVLQITGVETKNGRQILVVTKPAGGTLYAVNGPSAVDAGRYGTCTTDVRFIAAYDTGDGTPSSGAEWGPKSGQWTLDPDGAGYLVLGAVAADGRLHFLRRDDGTVKWCKAQSNWDYTGSYPGTGPPFVSVKECTDSTGSTLVGDAFNLLLPRNANGDPNVITGDILAWSESPSGEKVCVSDYMDLWVGACVWQAVSATRAGWGCMDGVANSVANGGSGIDMVSWFPLPTCAGTIGSTGGANTDALLGSTIASLLSNHAAKDTDYATTGITVADHPDHIHYVNCDCQTQTVVAATGPWAFTNKENNPTTIQKTTGGGSLTLSHSITEPSSGSGHRHNISAYSHSGSGQTDIDIIPPFKRLKLMERLNNSA